MTPALLEQILDHARAEAPRESCGVLVWDGKNGATYRHCQNIAEGEDHFAIHPEDWVAAEDAGAILGVVHSHPGGTTEPSEWDLQSCHRSGVPWWIVTPEGDWRRIAPVGWEVRGKVFAWGIQDCYTLARDAYSHMPDFVRGPGFWHNEDLFGNGLASAGFERVDGPPSPGDALLMSIRGNGVPNHCAIYLGGGRILHHLPGRLSREEDMGPLVRAVVAVVRRAL